MSLLEWGLSSSFVLPLSTPEPTPSPPPQRSCSHPRVQRGQGVLQKNWIHSAAALSHKILNHWRAKILWEGQPVRRGRAIHHEDAEIWGERVEEGECPRPGQLSAHWRARPGWGAGDSGRKKDSGLTVGVQDVISDDEGRVEGRSTDTDDFSKPHSLSAEA